MNFKGWSWKVSWKHVKGPLAAAVRSILDPRAQNHNQMLSSGFQFSLGKEKGEKEVEINWNSINVKIQWWEVGR